MARRNGKAGSPSPAHRTPKFVLEDGQSVEATVDHEVSRKPRGRPPLPPKPKMVTVRLQLRHSVNGKFFGPGVVTVPEKKAQMFLNVEHEAALKEDSLVRQQAFIVSFRNGVPVRREVPAQRFDDILAREELPLDVMPSERR